MFNNQSVRHAHILQKLREVGYISVEQVATELNVSTMTIRRDLKALQRIGLINRQHGGASATPDIGDVEFPIQIRELQEISVKKRLGKAAAALLRSGDVIIVDAGSTTLQIAQNLPSINLTVVTNGQAIVNTLAENDRIDLICTGGQLKWDNQCYVGPLAIQNIKSVNANFAFMSITALSLSRGLTTRDMNMAQVKRAMISVAETVVLVMDSSKMNKHTLSTVAALNEIDVLVTDSGIANEDRLAIEHEGVKVILADD